MKVLIVLLQLSLINHGTSFTLRKPTESHPSPSNIVNILEQQSLHYVATRDNDNFRNSAEIPRVGPLLESFKVPGFEVYPIVFDQNHAINSEKLSDLSPKLNTHVSSVNSHLTDDYVYYDKAEKRNGCFNNEIKKTPGIENILDYKLIEVNSNVQKSTEIEKSNEKTTTDINGTENYNQETTIDLNELTTNVGLLFENSTIPSDYYDEEERVDISPSLLASLVG